MSHSLRSFLRPQAIAVLGASRRRGTLGGELFHNLINCGFPGPIYPVNPKAEAVHGVAAYPDLLAVPGPVELAIVAVPAAGVVAAAEQCERKGVRALLVISAGFAEAGYTERQRALVEVCRRSGMRLIGPNCLGIVNTDPAGPLNATFAPRTPPPGNIGFLSQSGALGLAIIEYAQRLELGLSSFVSVGNKADVSSNDLLEYWEADAATSVILLYLESFGNPRKFARLAPRVARRKPIVAVKSGRSGAGARATASHTGALLAASDAVVEALFRQAGVIRTDTLEELFDVAMVLANQPLPRGRRVGILSNAGGPGILCADACEAAGLSVPLLPQATQSRLREILGPNAGVANPVDMIASASPENYRRVMGALGESGACDALVAIFVPPLVTGGEEVAQAIWEGASGLPAELPAVAVFMSSQGMPAELAGRGLAANSPAGARAGGAVSRPRLRVPAFTFPEAAARALARVADHAEWREQPAGEAVRPCGIARERAAAILAAAEARAAEWLTADDLRELLACYGLTLPWQAVARTGDEAAQLAVQQEGALALKGIAPGATHKSDLGLVRLGLAGAGAVRQAAGEMAERARQGGLELTGFLVQAMAEPGVEMMSGFVQDPIFGPVLVCGLGGKAVELLRDISLRLAPIGARDAAAMVRALRTFPLLTGFRGAPTVDLAALEDALLRLGALAADFPAIVEMDCNPIVVHERGASIVDARARLRQGAGGDASPAAAERHDVPVASG